MSRSGIPEALIARVTRFLESDLCDGLPIQIGSERGAQIASLVCAFLGPAGSAVRQEQPEDAVVRAYFTLVRCVEEYLNEEPPVFAGDSAKLIGFEEQILGDDAEEGTRLRRALERHRKLFADAKGSYQFPGLEDLELVDDLGGDPLDIGEGDIVMNAQREVRIVCMSYSGACELRVLWVDPRTGGICDEPSSSWSKWTGEQLWFLQNLDGDGWRLRNPFVKRIEHVNDPPA